MYFTECASLAEQYPDLASAIQRVDEQLYDMTAADVMRPEEFASILGIDANKVDSVFELLSQEGLLTREEMIECANCGMPVLRSDYESILNEDGEYRCTNCERILTGDTSKSIITFRGNGRWEECRGDHKEDSEGDEIVEPQNMSIKKWPDPEQNTTAKIWTTKDGTFCMSTKTDRETDGTVQFQPRENGNPTYQIQFMRLICFHHPNPVLLKDVMREVYSEDYSVIRKDPGAANNLLKKVRSLVSDIRTKKLNKAGINPDILPPFNVESSIDSGISLRLAHLHRMDDMELDRFDEPVF